ncbi:MAG: hypothetical protein ACP5VR_11950, partial [Acidimicrobiales bacterium]
ARQLWEDEPGPARAVVLISTHGEADFADLVEASPAAGFLPKWDLSARAVKELYAQHKAMAASAPSQGPGPSDAPLPPEPQPGR